MTLKEFAQKMRDTGVHVERSALQLKKGLAMAIDAAVVMATPVDTGRARANWIVGLGAPVQGSTEARDQSGSSTISNNDSTIAGADDDRPIFISNNLDYIVPLNEGHSAQAPAGFVEQSIQRGLAAVKNWKVLPE